MAERRTERRSLPLVRDSLSFLYLEHCRIEQDDAAVKAIMADGSVIPVPCASLLVLMLGPGTSITHAAIRNLGDVACQVVWCGEGQTRFYAHGSSDTNSARNVLRQASAFADPTTRLEVAKRMYEMRFDERVPANVDLSSLRGREGRRMAMAYRAAAKRYDVTWRRRDYRRDDWDAADAVNRALSIGNTCLYGLVRSVIVSLGYSPAIGFVHSGHALAFVHDIADLYKAELVIPPAFRESKHPFEGSLSKRMRIACREAFVAADLTGRIAEDIAALFDQVIGEDRVEAIETLWDPELGEVPAGVDWSSIP